MAKLVSTLCGCVKDQEREIESSRDWDKPSNFRGLTKSGEAEGVTDIAYIPNTQIVCGKVGGSLFAFDYTDGAIARRWKGHENKRITKICVEPTSGAGSPCSMFTSSRDLSVRMWNIVRNDIIPHCEQEFVGHHDLVVSAVACHPDDRNVICSGSRDNSVALWDVATGTVINSTKIPRNLVTDICWKGELLAQTSEDKSLRLWDARTLQHTHTFVKKQQILTSCDVNGSQIITSSGGFNGSGCEITLWDSRSGTMPVQEFKGHTEKVYKCCFVTGANNVVQYVASVSADRTIRLWNLATNSELSQCRQGFQLTSLTQLPSENAQSLRFAVASLEYGVMITTADATSAYKEWEIHE